MFVLRIFDRKTHEQMQFLFTPDKSTVPFFITFIYRMLDWLRGLLSNQNLFLPLCVQKCSYVLNCSSVRGISHCSIDVWWYSFDSRFRLHTARKNNSRYCHSICTYTISLYFQRKEIVCLSIFTDNF